MTETGYNGTGGAMHLAGRLGLLAMHLGEHALQPLLEVLVLGALVEFADEMAPAPEGVAREAKGGAAEILYERRESRSATVSKGVGL